MLFQKVLFLDNSKAPLTMSFLESIGHNSQTEGLRTLLILPRDLLAEKKMFAGILKMDSSVARKHRCTLHMGQTFRGVFLFRGGT